jgi:hypothetical protein
MTSRREDRDGPGTSTALVLGEKGTLEEGERSGAIYSLVVNTRPHSGALPRLCHVCTRNTLPLLRAEQAHTSAKTFKFALSCPSSLWRSQFSGPRTLAATVTRVVDTSCKNKFSNEDPIFRKIYYDPSIFRKSDFRELMMRRRGHSG